MATFFSADHHFGHANIIKYCDRPFSSVEEMDEELIRRWNDRVSPDDDVYYLGDFCMGNPRKYLNRLNGTVRFIPGSHDKDLRGVLLYPPLYTLDIYGKAIILCHYAMRSWDRSHYATWHLFGHHHGKLPPYGLSFDVGVDCWNYAPVSFEEVEQKMSTLKPIVDYRRK